MDQEKIKESKFIQFGSQQKLSDEFKMKCEGMPYSLFGADDGSNEEISGAAAIDGNHENKIYNIVSIRMKFNSKCYSGSGMIIRRESNKFYILTAAHNVMQYDENSNKIHAAASVEVQVSHNMKESKCHAAYGWVVRPEYIHNPKPKSENDIAIIAVNINDNDEPMENTKPIQLCESGSGITSYSGAKVIDYQGENPGELWEMTEDCKLDDDDHKSTIYEDIHASTGQDGSPIFAVNNDNNNGTLTTFDSITGFHTGQNHRIALNEYNLQWIADILRPSLAMKQNDNKALKALVEYIYYILSRH